MPDFKKSELKIVMQESEQKRKARLRKLLDRDSELRELLEERLPDDSKFEELTLEIVQNLQRAGSKFEEGIDRARKMASFMGLLEQLKKTERFKMGEEFIQNGKKTEEMTKEAKPKVMSKAA